MALTLYYHPFSSFCQKVLVALYELGMPFERRIVDLSDADERAELAALWPVTKFPVLKDDEAGLALPESTIIIEHLDRGRAALIPADASQALQVRLWDRVIDHYVEHPLQKIVGDEFRSEGGRDPEGVDQARATLRTAYTLLDAQLEGRDWIAGDSFSMADCGAGPALFYAQMLEPIAGDYARLHAYWLRLRERPSFARAVDEARPYRAFFPLPWAPGVD